MNPDTEIELHLCESLYRLRGMEVRIGRNKEKLKLAKPHSFLAQERSIVEMAYPGDIVGLYDPGKLRIGDTLSAKNPISL